MVKIIADPTEIGIGGNPYVVDPLAGGELSRQPVGIIQEGSEGQNATETVAYDIDRVATLFMNESRQGCSVVVECAADRGVAEDRYAHAVLAFEPAFDQVHPGTGGQVPVDANDRFLRVTQCAVPAA